MSQLEVLDIKGGAESTDVIQNQCTNTVAGCACNLNPIGYLNDDGKIVWREKFEEKYFKKRFENEKCLASYYLYAGGHVIKNNWNTLMMFRVSVNLKTWSFL